MSNEAVNYWKFATIGILLVGVTVAATLLAVGRDGRDSETERTASVAQTDVIPIPDETPVPVTEKKASAPAQEAAVGHQRWGQHRCGATPLPGAEDRQRGQAGDPGDQDDRVGPAERGRLQKREHEQGQRGDEQRVARPVDRAGAVGS